MASQSLHGRKIAILLAPAGSEQVEFTEPKKAVHDAGKRPARLLRRDRRGVRPGHVCVFGILWFAFRLTRRR